MRQSHAVICLAVLLVLPAIGCTPSTDADGSKIRAVCTTGMVADMVARIGGDRVAVDQLMGEGVDPHLFKATPDVPLRIDRADVVFYSGLHLEGRMTDVLEKLPQNKAVALTSTIPAEKLIDVG